MLQGRVGADRISVLALCLGAVLCAGAVVLIIEIVGDPHPETLVGKIGFTAFFLTVFGPCAATGLHLAERRPGLRLVGLLITAIALLSFAAVAIRTFEEGPTIFSVAWELQAIGLALTLALAQVALALAYDCGEDPLGLRLVTLGTSVSILALGGLSALEVAVEDVRLSAGFFGVLISLYLLGAALLALFRLAAWQHSRSSRTATP